MRINISINYKYFEKEMLIKDSSVSDLEIELWQKNVVIDYLHSQLSLKTADNLLSSSVIQHLNDTSNQDSVCDKLRLPL